MTAAKALNRAVTEPYIDGGPAGANVFAPQDAGAFNTMASAESHGGRDGSRNLISQPSAFGSDRHLDRIQSLGLANPQQREQSHRSRKHPLASGAGEERESHFTFVGIGSES